MTKEEMLDELTKIASELEETPTRQEFIAYSKTKYGYLQHWPRYNDFIKEAGLKPHNKGKAAHPLLSKEQVIDAFQEYVEIHHEQPTYKQFRETYPSEARSMKVIFKKFNKLVEAAGGKTRRVYAEDRGKHPWTKEELVALMKQDMTKEEIPASTYAFIKKHHMAFKWVKELFGSYDNLIAAAKEESILKVHRSTVNQLYTKRYKVQYSSMSVILKWTRRRDVRWKV